MIEEIEAGTSLFLIDEDTSATNFMIRDELMQRVIHREMEPITPFIERIRELYENYGISTVIVAGSSGAYFHIADSIIQMDHYVPKDITVRAKKEACEPTWQCRPRRSRWGSVRASFTSSMACPVSTAAPNLESTFPVLTAS